MYEMYESWEMSIEMLKLSNEIQDDSFGSIWFLPKNATSQKCDGKQLK